MSMAENLATEFELGPAPEHDLFSNHHRYGDLDDWNAAMQDLHSKGGIFRVERKGVHPFWAVIDYKAITEIATQPELFTNAPRIRLMTDEQYARVQASPTKTLIHMDGEEHKHFRALTADWFRIDKVRGLESRLTEMSQQAIAKLEAAGGEVDFAEDIAMPYPLQVILNILGIPEEDFGFMMKLTQDFFGEEDPDLKRDPNATSSRAEVMKDFADYFNDLTRARRKNPTDDLASVIANGKVQGKLLTDHEALSYYILVATAGHDTTSSTMAGACHAFIENPDQMRFLQENPGQIKKAVEEMIRWTSPVRHFTRTAQADTEILGQKIKKGDLVAMSFRGGNYDPKVFPDPLKFDVQRREAVKQLSFGFARSAHVCLGNMLARSEIANFYSHLLPRIETIEFNGTPTTSKTTTVGGHKTLPIKYTLKPAA